MADLDDTLPGIPQRISDAGLEFIMQAEGCRLEAYRDSVGVLTIGYGHTRLVADGDRITQDEATALLREDLGKVYTCIGACVTLPLTQGQFDALCSFAFNLGCGALKGSTLLKMLNSGDYSGAEQQFQRWNKAGGSVLAGLTKRRAGEAQMFSEA